MIHLHPPKSPRRQWLQVNWQIEYYENLSSTHIVMTMVIETMGSWGLMGLGFIKKLGARITNVTKDDKST